MVSFDAPSGSQCPTSIRLYLKASPKAVSGRTSYLRVRLEFLPYPHLIATLFNGCACGPPKPAKAPSSWTWVDHPVSGLRIPTISPIKTRSPCGSVSSLTYPRRHTPLAGPFYKKYTVPLECGSTACKHRVSGSLSLPSRGPFHLSLTVLSSIGHFGCLALGGGPPCFLQGSTCLTVLWYRLVRYHLRVRGFHPLWQAFPKPFYYPLSIPYAVRTPERTRSGLPSFLFARRYSGNRCFFLFLPVLRCFSSRACLPYVMDSRMDVRSSSVRVAPFRRPRIIRYVLLPAAFRSLSRLSSAQSAKASAPRPSSLDLLNGRFFKTNSLARRIA